MELGDTVVDDIQQSMDFGTWRASDRQVLPKFLDDMLNIVNGTRFYIIDIITDDFGYRGSHLDTKFFVEFAGGLEFNHD